MLVIRGKKLFQATDLGPIRSMHQERFGGETPSTSQTSDMFRPGYVIKMTWILFLQSCVSMPFVLIESHL